MKQLESKDAGKIHCVSVYTSLVLRDCAAEDALPVFSHQPGDWVHLKRNASCSRQDTGQVTYKEKAEVYA